MVNTLAARNLNSGVYLLRAHTNSQLEGLIAAGQVQRNWLIHEEAVPGRLVQTSDKSRWEYAGVYTDARTGELGVIGVEGAEQIGNILQLIDRKLVWVKAGRVDEVMQSLYKAAQFLKQNANTKLAYEFNPGVIREELMQLTRAKEMLEKIRSGTLP